MTEVLLTYDKRTSRAIAKIGFMVLLNVKKGFCCSCGSDQEGKSVTLSKTAEINLQTYKQFNKTTKGSLWIAKTHRERPWRKTWL